jgi:hypothetical protein
VGNIAFPAITVCLGAYAYLANTMVDRNNKSALMSKCRKSFIARYFDLFDDDNCLDETLAKDDITSTTPEYSMFDMFDDPVYEIEKTPLFKVRVIIVGKK